MNKAATDVMTGAAKNGPRGGLNGERLITFGRASKEKNGGTGRDRSRHSGGSSCRKSAKTIENQTRSTIMAIPMPPPMHMEIMPVDRLFRLM